MAKREPAKRELARSPDIDDKILIKDEMFNVWIPKTVVEADDEQEYFYTSDGKWHDYSEYPIFWKYADED